MPRKSATPVTQADVVIKSKRRCALCFGLDQNLNERVGQIAHLDGNNQNSQFGNLVWLCLEHHDKFDSTTSQTKNYTPIEVRTYRDNLYLHFNSTNFSQEDIQETRTYLKEFGPMFEYLFNEYEELAFRIDADMLDTLANIRDFWHTSPLRSFNSKVRGLQDSIANNIVGLCGIYQLNMYDAVGSYIKFDSQNFKHSELTDRRALAREYIDSIGHSFHDLQAIAVL
ncbi:hypothetical protein [Janthinobacterium sp. GW458P]|uniref:hypothetical protein n=1 Tax=Janthinobacterium sp. GW458P TaxID=1981504 RepID=UPI001120DF1C|nr:hypothetical protein [Janthinobacterium sp. GW458P]MBE3025972.1 hypothetical protein [Janthinobacterium sp. GW458P]